VVSPEPDAPLPCGPAPPPGTLERWAWDYLRAPELDARFELPPPPPARAREPGAPARATLRPTRPSPLRVIARAEKSPTAEALRAPARRAQLVHTFLHHEAQAAELMCWAILAYPDAPDAFRAGLAAIARDEVRHMGLYRAYLAAQRVRYGALPVRDWFWQRVPHAASPAHFVATLGVGLEGANLDHAARFAERLRAVGDLRGAALQEQIAAEEAPHVRFALHWFERFTGGRGFAAWRAHLVPPLSPLVMRGEPLAEAARRGAGFPAEFVAELVRWRAPGC
jgi:uncharacterized ferritin-like protein (DUF455 family)